MYGRVAEHLWVKRPQEAVLQGWFKKREALFWPLKGPGGAGKTSLLFRFLDTCKTHSVPVVWTQPDADLAALAGDRRALRLLLMLQTAHTPEFDKLKAELASPDVAKLFDEATAKIFLNEGAKHLLQDLQGWAGLAQQFLSLVFKKLGADKDARRRDLAARPEEFLLTALCKDMKAGGVWLVDTWEKVGPEHQLAVQTRLLHRGGLETCPVAREITVDLWLQELAVLFSPAPILWVITGRNVLVEFGDMRNIPETPATVHTTAFSRDEIADFLGRRVADPPPEVVAHIQAQTGGNPREVDRIAVAALTERRADLTWTWMRWYRDTAGMSASTVAAFNLDRLSELRLAGDRRFWRLAVPATLRDDMAEVLFPADEAHGRMSGADILAVFLDIGILSRHPSLPDTLVLHDDDRRDLRSRAEAEGLWDSPEAYALHRRIAAYLDARTGWPEAFPEPEAPSYPDPEGRRADSQLTEAAFHLIMADGDFDRRCAPATRQEFWEALRASVSVQPVLKRLLDGGAGLNAWQVQQMLATWNRERTKLGQLTPLGARLVWLVDGGVRNIADLQTRGVEWRQAWEQNRASAFLFEMISEIHDVDMSDLRSLVDDVETFGDEKALRICGNFLRKIHDYDRAECFFIKALAIAPDDPDLLGDCANFMVTARQDMAEAERLYRAAEVVDPKHARNLATFAVFMKNVRQDMDEAERLYRAAEAADPKYAHNLGAFAWFMQMVRQDMDEAERLYRAAEAADPKHASNLATFAVFMKNVRQDMDEAERLYRAAEAADPKHADNLGNFALFMQHVRQDMNEAERLYRAAEAADPEHAHNLGNFAWFMQSVRQSMDEAERLYRAAEAADSKHARNLENFALFMQNVHKNIDEAEFLYWAAIAADPKRANSLGNLACILIAAGRVGEAAELVGRAVEVANPEDERPLILECWFYRYAVYPEWRERALGEMAGLIGDGVRSPGWDLRGVVARGEALGHPRPDLLRAVAAVIAEEAGADTLAAFGDWPKAA